MLLFTQCKSDGVKFKFDGTKEMSGAKFALKDINPDLPADWDGYNFVVLEYKISTAQRFQLGGDDGKARPLDVGGEMMLRCHVRLLPFRPIAA